MSRAGEPTAVFETLTPHPASVASAHLKFYDQQQAKIRCLREAVIENPDDWDAADLNLLQQVASHVRPMTAPWTDLAALVA